MRNSSILFLLVIFMMCSCTKTSEGPTNLIQTLRLTNESMRKNVDLQLNTAIWTDEQRGRNNEELTALLKQLADSRKDLDHRDLTAVKVYVSRLVALKIQIKDDLGLDQSFVRVDAYLNSKDQDAQTQELLVAELTYIEYSLVEHWSRQLGIVDCCFPSPMTVQTNGAVAGELYEMAIFPNGDRSLWDHATFAYENFYLTKAGRKVPVDLKTNQIGHVMMVQFTPKEAGEYLVHFSVTESGDYVATPWQQDFEWPIVMQ
ncbi:MAG: hypothetical protein R8G66_25185 [Cytophagales bacterium]|nr:hypothetical protein [Cytophagales bacterium]